MFPRLSLPRPQNQRSHRSRLEVLQLEDRVVPAAGDLDLAFGNNGTQTLNLPFSGNATAIDGQGNILVVGTLNAGGTDTDMGVFRLRPDGTLDTSFSPLTNGIIQVSFNSGTGVADEATDLAIDSQGRIVVVGSAQHNMAGDFKVAVARLRPVANTGAFILDATFDGDGRVLFDFDVGGLMRDLGSAVAIDTQGRIVIGASVEVGMNVFDFGVTRLTESGSLDAAFVGGNGTLSPGAGRLHFDIDGNNDDRLADLALDSQGRIVAVGQTALGTSSDFAVARLLQDGALDGGFDGGTRKTVSFDQGGNNSDAARAVVIDTQDRIIAAGFATINADNDTVFAVARLLPNGNEDPAFGNLVQPGKSLVAHVGGNQAGLENDEAHVVAIDWRGRILLGGFTDKGAEVYDFALARLTEDGELDNNFAGDGVQIIDFALVGSTSDPAFGMAVQADRSVVLVGRTQSGTDSDFAAARVIGRNIIVIPQQVRRSITAELTRKKNGKLLLVVRFADTGDVKSTRRSPLQPGRFGRIMVSTIDKDGDGITDTIVLTPRRGKPLEIADDPVFRTVLVTQEE